MPDPVIVADIGAATSTAWHATVAAAHQAPPWRTGAQRRQVTGCPAVVSVNQAGTRVAVGFSKGLVIFMGTGASA